MADAVELIVNSAMCLGTIFSLIAAAMRLAESIANSGDQHDWLLEKGVQLGLRENVLAQWRPQRKSDSYKTNPFWLGITFITTLKGASSTG